MAVFQKLESGDQARCCCLVKKMSSLVLFCLWLVVVAAAASAARYNNNNNNNDVVRAAVVRGREVPPGKYPWFVTFDVGCGGFMAARDIAITAAHCDPPAWTVRRGTYDLSNTTGTVERRVLAFVRHPSYYPNMATENDVRVVLLDSNDDVFPAAAMANATSHRPTMLSIVGMGDTEDASVPWGRVLEANVSVFTCPERRERLCSGTSLGNPCYGDSGGPLFDPATHTVYGVVSGGPGGCTQGGFYTSLSYQADFVAEARATIVKFRDEAERVKLCDKMFTVYRRIVLEDTVAISALQTCATPMSTRYPHAVYVDGTWFACRCRGQISSDPPSTQKFPWAKFPTTVLRAPRANISAACPSCVHLNTVVSLAGVARYAGRRV